MMNGLQRTEKKIDDFIYNEKDVIGVGITGNVYRGHKVDETPVAVKVIKQAFGNTDSRYNLLYNQIDACKIFNHKNILKVYETVRRNGCTYIISQISEQGTLRNLIKKKGNLQQIQALLFFQGLIDGLSEISRNNIIHRDLKSENILLRENGQPIIIDFGVCKFTNNGHNQKDNFNVGSFAYMPPEAFNNNTYSEKSDIWSLGVILYQMVTGYLLKIQAKTIDKHFKDLQKKQRPEIKFNFKNRIVDILLKKCLTVSIDQRADIKQIKELINDWKNEQNVQEKFKIAKIHLQLYLKLCKQERLQQQAKLLQLKRIKSQMKTDYRPKQGHFLKLKLGQSKSKKISNEKYKPSKVSSSGLLRLSIINQRSNSSSSKK